MIVTFGRIKRPLVGVDASEPLHLCLQSNHVVFWHPKDAQTTVIEMSNGMQLIVDMPCTEISSIMQMSQKDGFFRTHLSTGERNCHAGHWDKIQKAHKAKNTGNTLGVALTHFPIGDLIDFMQDCIAKSRFRDRLHFEGREVLTVGDLKIVVDTKSILDWKNIGHVTYRFIKESISQFCKQKGLQ